MSEDFHGNHELKDKGAPVLMSLALELIVQGKWPSPDALLLALPLIFLLPYVACFLKMMISELRSPADLCWTCSPAPSPSIPPI